MTCSRNSTANCRKRLFEATNRWRKSTGRTRVRSASERPAPAATATLATPAAVGPELDVGAAGGAISSSIALAQMAFRSSVVRSGC